MMPTDFIVWGEVEARDDDSVSVQDVMLALQPRGPHKGAVCKPILLCSNRAGCCAFVTATGMCSMYDHEKRQASSDAVMTGKASEAAQQGEQSTVTDFVLVGEAEAGNEGTGLTSVCQSLLPHNPRRCLVRPIVLTSNNNKCTHWVMNGMSSTPITTADVLWMEKVAGLRKGW